MLYRPYQPGDFDQICAIEKACFQPPLRYTRRYLRELLAAPGAIAWVAALESAEAIPALAVGVRGRRLVGFVLAGVMWAHGKKIVYLETLEVVEGARRRGAGAELLRRVGDAARAAEIGALWLHVAANNAAALGLYSAHGFEIQGREENYYGPGIHGLVCVQRLALSGQTNVL